MHRMEGFIFASARPAPGDARKSGGRAAGSSADSTRTEEAPAGNIATILPPCRKDSEVAGEVWIFLSSTGIRVSDGSEDAL